MKFLNVITVAMLLIIGPTAFATKDRGGGDICEDRIKVIRDDIFTWIDKKGPEGLTFPQGITVASYISAMKEQTSAKIKCVGEGDIGFPIEIDGTPKVCRFDITSSGKSITCDYTKFNATNESEQYVLTHHEYAGLAQLEVPNGDDSKYELSNQISDYLVEKIVKKLSVKRRTCPGSSCVSDQLKSWREYFHSARPLTDFSKWQKAIFTFHAQGKNSFGPAQPHAYAFIDTTSVIPIMAFSTSPTAWASNPGFSLSQTIYAGHTKYSNVPFYGSLVKELDPVTQQVEGVYYTPGKPWQTRLKGVVRIIGRDLIVQVSVCEVGEDKFKESFYSIINLDADQAGGLVH